jgi:ribosomal protein S6--L-glutamate ligase
MRIGLIMFRHPPDRESPIMPEVIRLLSEWGATVDPIYPEEQLTDLDRVQVDHDLYVLKSGTELALCLGGALHVAGAALLNPYPIAVMMRDKIVATRALQAAGIPLPETYITAHVEQLVPLLDQGPMIVKPYRGSQGRGIQVISQPDELSQLVLGPDPVFAQRYHKPHGPDLKIYRIGDQTFGVKRVWPARTYQEKLGEPFDLSPELQEITWRCGEAFGISLYGLDVVFSDGQPYVVDASSFPGFKGVPDAPVHLANYIYSMAGRVLNCPLPAGGGAVKAGEGGMR